MPRSHRLDRQLTDYTDRIKHNTIYWNDHESVRGRFRVCFGGVTEVLHVLRNLSFLAMHSFILTNFIWVSYL